jgi:hypothetical protein
MRLFMSGVLQLPYSILIIYHSVLGVKEASLSLLQAVCNFSIQHISILSFITWSEGPFSLSQAVFSSLESSILFVY